jgi:hypothetical protein
MDRTRRTSGVPATTSIRSRRGQPADPPLEPDKVQSDHQPATAKAPGLKFR